MTRFCSIVAVTLAAALASTPGQAKETEVTFQYDPTQLTSPQGVAAVYEQLRLVAKHTCEVPSPIQKRQEFECRRSIENDLIAKIDSPTLLAISQGSRRLLHVAKGD